MSTESKAAQPTQGALRAGRNISERFRRALPHLPETNADTLAAIIDAETGASELLEALEHCAGIIECQSQNTSEEIWPQIKQQLDFAAIKARAAIAKAQVTK